MEGGGGTGLGGGDGGGRAGGGGSDGTGGGGAGGGVVGGLGVPVHCACSEATLVTGARPSIAHLGALDSSISEPVRNELSLSVQ